MIFSIILICVIGRDFGCMLNAERASQPGPSQNHTPPNEMMEETRSGPTTPCPSINGHNDGGDEIVSSVEESERGEGCCQRRRGREGNNAAAKNTEMQRCCGSSAQDEDLDESVFTG